jgi:ferredoxin
MMTDKQASSSERITAKVILRFPSDIINEPIVCQLAVKYGLVFNILRADINPDEEGILILELSGSPENYEQGLAYLKQNQVLVEPLSQRISRDDDKCTQCGVCMGVCPSGAFVLGDGHRVIFESEKCIACELCLKACPPRAMMKKL